MKDGYHIVLDRILPAGEATEEGKAACCVHLLVADVSELMADEELLAQQTATLSPQRQAKAAAISNLRNRALSVGVALLFDRLLQEVGLREHDMEYVEGEHGKPEAMVNMEILKNGNIEKLKAPCNPPVGDEGKGGKIETWKSGKVVFNLSHSGRMVAAAMMQPFRDSTDAPPSPIQPTSQDFRSAPCDASRLKNFSTFPSSPTGGLQGASNISTSQSFRSAPCEFLEVSSDKVERTLEESFNFSTFLSSPTGGLQGAFNSPPPLLGLDIQHITRYRPELVRRMFNDTDRARLAACTDETARQRLFAQLWCRAEAFAKATGEGLRWPFPTPPSNAHFTDFEVGEEYCGSVCLINV